MKLPSSSSWLRRSLIVLLVLGAGVAAMLWFGRSQPVAVVAATVGRGKVEASVSNTRAGSIEACQRTRLSTIIGGRIEVLAVKEGDRVRKGQLLLKLWNDDQQAQQTLAQTQLESARKHITEACTSAAAAAREADRQTALRAQGFISTAGEDKARSEADVRQALCEAARADVKQAEARVQATRVEQGRTVLVAPFDGTSTVDIDVDFDQLAAARPLLVGYSADVEVVLAVLEQVLRVPTAALGDKGRVLVLGGADGTTLVERHIKAGLTNWEYTEVLDGLREGEQVVTSLERVGVLPGARVRLDAAPASAAAAQP